MVCDMRKFTTIIFVRKCNLRMITISHSCEETRIIGGIVATENTFSFLTATET